jgi:hypothetical protein
MPLRRRIAIAWGILLGKPVDLPRITITPHARGAP